MRSGRRPGRARLVPYLMLSPSYLFIAALMVLPLGLAFLYSFQSYMIFDPFNRAFIGLGNYLNMLRDPVFWTAMGNTLIWTLLSLILQFVLGLALALLLNAGPFPGKRLYQAVVFLPWAVPGFLIGMTWKWMFNAEFGVVHDLLMKLGILAQPLGFLSSPKWALLSVVAANVWFGVPFFAITLLAGWQAIPDEIHEAGTIDGASPCKRFWYVTLPLLRSTIIVSTMLRIIWIANFPDLIYIMTEGGPGRATMVLVYYIYLQAFVNQNFGYASAMAAVFFLLILGVTIFQFRLQERWVTYLD